MDEESADAGAGRSLRIEIHGRSEERSCVAAFAVFHGTQTGPRGPGLPTGRTIVADYVYAMEFDGNQIKHMTKIWNDTISLEQLDWS
jgi:hypothetical protein